MEKILREKLPDGGFAHVEPRHHRVMQGVRGKANRTTEARLRGAMARAGIRGWIMNAQNIKGCPDVFFPKEQIAVFVDGCFWHGCPDHGKIPESHHGYWRSKIVGNMVRDEENTVLLEEDGWVVWRIWEHDLQPSSLSGVRRRLRRRFKKLEDY